MTAWATDGSWIEVAGRGLIVTTQNVGLLLDTVRQVRRMSVEAGATYYGVFLVSRTTPQPALALCFDRKFPRSSETSRILCGERGVAWLAAAGRSMTPFWWHGEIAHDRCPAFPLLVVGQETPPLTPDLPGLALPAFADDGAQGFVVLAGGGIGVDDALVCDLHLRTLTLFGTVARMLLSQTGEVPAMSKRELQCLRLTAQGKTSDEIAAALGLSIHTANQYLTATTQKLDAVNRMHAVAKALRLGLID
ncbi:helix-turn-helix transcriptional regulator [Aquibium sp. ELW1220]|uniref:response regulator transcription factor n=1 Tax=Aquibium sp. ELW1220 TaxID=2976766 RepID=UPI0025B014FD|nr:helix-turn-helix transcriptional regulator [Aquibium sp. ELW1220]